MQLSHENLGFCTRHNARLLLLALTAVAVSCILSRLSQAQEPNDTSIAAHAATPAHPIAPLKRALTRDMMTVPAPSPAPALKADDDLTRIIAQIRSVTFEEPKPPSEPPELTMDSLRPEPNDAPPTGDTPLQPLDLPTASKPDYKPVSEKTLAEFARFTEDPNLIPNPFELAEVLYNSRRFAQAAQCYRKALEFAAAGDPKSNEKRAWILFQLANSSAADDLEAARAFYAQLITEHPTSEWTEVAKAKLALIDWIAREKPRELITQQDENQ